MNSGWAQNMLFEIETTTNWSAELLLPSSTPRSVILRENVIPGKDVFLLSSCFSLQECRQIIAASEEIGGNCRLITIDVELAKTLWGRILPHMPPIVQEDGCVWEVVGLNECFRLSKYVEGDVFQAHVDSSFQRSINEKSMFTVNIYLNGADDFQGGFTRFYSDTSLAMEYAVAPVAGVGLIFRQPPFAHYSHDGERVNSGTKYLIRSDVMYRKVETDEE